MRANYTVNESVQFRILSEGQISEIVGAAIEILETTGAVFYSTEALEMLKQAGAHINGNRARIPSALTKQALQSAPNSVGLYNSRTGKKAMALAGYNSYYGTGSDTPYFVDPLRGERLRARYQDVANAAKVIDALPHVDFCMSLGLVQDVPRLTSDRYQFKAMVTNTGKPMVITAHDIQGFADIVAMSEEVAGGTTELRARPFLVLYAEPISPLQHPKDSVDKLLFAAEHGIPVVYTPAPMAGATAPCTLAGTLASGISESLGGLVIHQLKQAGAPFIMGGVFTIMDMRTTIFSYAAPEFNLLQAAQTDVAHYLGLPIFCTAGCSDSNVLDQQAAAEAMFSILVTGQSGANLIHDVGYLEYGSTGSLEMLVMSNELIGMAKRFVRGIRVNKETLATEVVDQVGPGGHFLGEQHTLDYMRSEFWTPSLMNRKRYDEWKDAGAKTLGDRAHEQVLNILAEHTPVPLTKQQLDRFDEIIRNADQRHGYQ
ncbi:trimethylamine-corrinoid protein Co-methyltransferase [Acididesulfobacillus acetoxydans]|uniref:Trimethylamine methyltransferase MttB n=1 Tax=Acididesulfobacillus acetoxydans TaxID=1561005 RepID=A0A8S0WF18_9FIRM|nr:trimethylamine methyltransferase family protein [Acididesulfobacillus acetoxydans]CAA7600602.1 trimethylamine-corrinoid protein Co-methyltransferase [Acididesulfobacillus acetoxydans]CEJ09383.1 Trimethylamine methyltransferase MttB [Acididesulfobacillus acetoxydans]